MVFVLHHLFAKILQPIEFKSYLNLCQDKRKLISSCNRTKTSAINKAIQKSKCKARKSYKPQERVLFLL